MVDKIPNFGIGTDLTDVENYVNSNKLKMNKEAVQCIFNFINDERSVGDGKISNNVELTMLNSFLERAMDRGNNDKDIKKPTKPDETPNDNPPLKRIGYRAALMLKAKKNKETSEINKTSGIPMPEPVQLDDPNITYIHFGEGYGKNEFMRQTNKNLKESSSSSASSEIKSQNFKAWNRQDTGWATDELVDYEGDGIADYREFSPLPSVRDDQLIRASYFDKDLDGSFERKEVRVYDIVEDTKVGKAAYKKDEQGKWRLDKS